MDILKVQNLSKYYHKKILYENINMTVKEGDCYGIIGADNEGKTTFIHSILGLNNYSKGDFLIFNEKKISKEIRQKIGYVPDQLLFFPSMTGAELLDMTIKFAQANVDYDYITELIDYMGVNVGLSLLDMDENDNKCIYIINALLMKPKLLVLDEPFNYLSDEGSFRLRRLLQKECDEGMTILIVSDSYDNLHGICNKCCIIRGRTTIKYDVDMEEYHTQKLIVVKKDIHYTPFFAELPDGLEIIDETISYITYLYKEDFKKLNNILSIFTGMDYTIQDLSIYEQLYNVEKKEEL